MMLNHLFLIGMGFLLLTLPARAEVEPEALALAPISHHHIHVSSRYFHNPEIQQGWGFLQGALDFFASIQLVATYEFAWTPSLRTGFGFAYGMLRSHFLALGHYDFPALWQNDDGTTGNIFAELVFGKNTESTSYGTEWGHLSPRLGYQWSRDAFQFNASLGLASVWQNSAQRTGEQAHYWAPDFSTAIGMRF